MNPTIDLRPALSFIQDLRENNNRPWFEQNRAYYEQARDAFESFVNYLINKFRESDQLQGLTARECVARIYRDIRFSKDKSPYKTGLGARIAPGGWKATRLGYYVHLEPSGQTVIAGGLYMPEPGQLARFRRAMDRDATQFRQLTQAKSFLETFGTIRGEKLKTAPQGYDRSHPEIELLQLKQVTVVHPYSDAEVLAPDFPTRALAVCRTMKPFLDYLDGVLEEA
jgi:uncharacterized protein (TIGR02453 family)